MKYVPLDDITLESGGHTSRKDGVCLMEAVAWYAGEHHSDTPGCVCPILGTMGRSLNDALPDDKRIRLLQFVPRVVGTAGDRVEQQRGFMAMDWIVRTYTPTWLRLAGLGAEAMRLEALAPVTDVDTLEAAMPALEKARAVADSAWDAARDAARVAAWDAARGAAWDAARDAARVAAWDAAWDAARVAARGAAWGAAWGAARDAAWVALAPTVSELQNSAIELYGRMIALRPEGVEVEVPERVMLGV